MGAAGAVPPPYQSPQEDTIELCRGQRHEGNNGSVAVYMPSGAEAHESFDDADENKTREILTSI